MPQEEIRDRNRDIERRREVAESLSGILAILNSDHSLTEILDTVTAEAMRLLYADGAAIYRVDDSGQNLTIHTYHGLSPDYAACSIIPIGRLATGRAVRLRRPEVIVDVKSLASEAARIASNELREQLKLLATQYQSVLSVPLIINHQAEGAITLYYHQPRSFSEEEINLAVTFANQTALIIENSRLRRKSQEDAIAAERNRLARELHDSVTQLLFSASLIAEVLPTVLERDPQEGKQGLAELRQLTRGALAEMRSLLLELRPSGLMEVKLEDLVRQLGDAYSSRMRVPVEVIVEGNSRLSQDVRLALYRIAQEGLNNIAKHARAQQVQLSLKTTTTQLGNQTELRICDDGCGFDPGTVSSEHLGLGIMQERASSVGAKLTVQSKPGCGTEVTIFWPDPNQPEDKHVS